MLPQNLRSRDGHTSYDGWGELHANTAGDVFYFYDALGRRISNDHTAQLIYSQNGQVLEDRHLTPNGQGGATLNSIDRQVWGLGYIDQMVLRGHVDESTQTTTRVYALQDANYNTVAITDSTGNVLDRFAYDPDGNVRSGNPTADGWIYLWQGLRHEAAGSTYMYDGRSRFYSPVLGRWIQPDIAYLGGTSLYQAFGSNAANRVDPFGYIEIAGGGGFDAGAWGSGQITPFSAGTGGYTSSLPVEPLGPPSPFGMQWELQQLKNLANSFAKTDKNWWFDNQCDMQAANLQNYLLFTWMKKHGGQKPHYWNVGTTGGSVTYGHVITARHNVVLLTPRNGNIYPPLTLDTFHGGAWPGNWYNSSCKCKGLSTFKSSYPDPVNNPSIWDKVGLWLDAHPWPSVPDLSK